MRLVRKADHHRWDLSILQGAKHFFTTGVSGRAPIGFTENQHQGSLYVVDIGDWRARLVIFRIFERRRFEPGWLKEREISGVPPVGPVGDVALGNGRRESSCLSDRPIRQQSTAAAAGYAEFLLVDIAALD